MVYQLRVLVHVPIHVFMETLEGLTIAILVVQNYQMDNIAAQLSGGMGAIFHFVLKMVVVRATGTTLAIKNKFHHKNKTIVKINKIYEYCHDQGHIKFLTQGLYLIFARACAGLRELARALMAHNDANPRYIGP